jgi:ATP-dependent DNA ligase
MLYAFDLLELDCEDLRSLPLTDRKNRLAQPLACGIRGNAATDSDGKRPPIPIESGHRFRSNAATLLKG